MCNSFSTLYDRNLTFKKYLKKRKIDIKITIKPLTLNRVYDAEIKCTPLKSWELNNFSPLDFILNILEKQN